MISSEEDNDESRDLIKSRSCLMIDGGWLDSIFTCCIWLLLFFVKGDKKNFQGWVTYIYIKLIPQRDIILTYNSMNSIIFMIIINWKM